SSERRATGSNGSGLLPRFLCQDFVEATGVGKRDMRLFSRLFGKGQAAQAAASPTMISLVILLREALLLNRATVEMALDNVFPGKFVPRNEDSFVVDGPSPTQLMVKSLVPSHSGLFLIIFPAERYFGPTGLDSSAWDPKTLELVRKHRAWLSI